MPTKAGICKDMVTQEVKKLAIKICDYLKMDQELESSDCILVLGTYDERLAVRGAELYLQGYAPLLIFSGGFGTFAKEHWGETEADHFKTIALRMGVPEKDILIENRSTNTGENILFTRKLLEAKRFDPHRFILVQKPYMGRRSYATFRKRWPEKQVLVTSPQISFEEYPTKGISMERVIHTAVGDLQRMSVYPELGYQIFQEIPNDVWSAFEKLVAMGYDRRLIAKKGDQQCQTLSV